MQPGGRSGTSFPVAAVVARGVGMHRGNMVLPRRSWPCCRGSFPRLEDATLSGSADGSGGNVVLPPEDIAAKLEDSGISKATSSRVQLQ
jgi:hypothetical protein